MGGYAFRHLGKWFWLCLLLGSRGADAHQRFDALCYHVIRDQVTGHYDQDQYAVSTDTLVQHFSWLREHGYTPVSIDDLLAAEAGKKLLPPKSVLLTFDDGYVSFYTHVYPLLKLFDYPAVFAIVGSWLEVPAGGQVPYGEKLVPRSQFLSWEQIREMHGSGLVEIASHSFDLHHGVLGNPQGNLQPAAITRIFDAARGRYESEAVYRQRVYADLKRNSDLIAQRIGEQPRVMVWPYGTYNSTATAIAAELGMSVTFSLDEKPARIGELANAGRFLLESNPSMSVIIRELLKHAPEKKRLRVAHIDLDYVYDGDGEQQKRNLDRLLDRIRSLRINTVFLQAFADPDGDGGADQLYYPNRHLPVRRDLFSRVAWQLKTRAGVDVYAWMPVLAFDLPSSALRDRLALRAAGEGGGSRYRRLSPFNAQARQIIKALYQDLARYASFDGLLFHDDAFMTDFEDASTAALAQYQKWGLPASIDEIRRQPALQQRWTAQKTKWLIDFTHELRDVVKAERPRLKTARNLYARVVSDADAQGWFAQSLTAFIDAYDYTALMAMPYLEQVEQPEPWLVSLVDAVSRVPYGLARTVFELQTRDWRSEQPVPTARLVKQAEILLHGGAQHLAYYPDDFLGGHPHLPQFLRAISASDYPFPLP